MKQFYQKMVAAVTPEAEHHDRFEVDLEVFEEDMKEMLDVSTIQTQLQYK